MAKVFNSFEKVAIKNAAKAIAAIRMKQVKLRKTIETLEAQCAAHDEEVKVFEDSVKGITGGYAPTELCRKEVRESGKQADWVFVYPDTIVPPTNEGSPIVEHPETEEEARNPQVNGDGFILNAQQIEEQIPEVTPEDWKEPQEDPMNDLFKD